MIDSLSKENMKNHLVEECDAVEILPGLLFKIIKELSVSLNKPLIAGGLISDKEDVMETLMVQHVYLQLKKKFGICRNRELERKLHRIVFCDLM